MANLVAFLIISFYFYRQCGFFCAKKKEKYVINIFAVTLELY